jgi:phosphatidylinositol-3,4,5-trisphosphate 3-phosphatase and dual-specificity protein phosphatase PTEN
VQRFFEKRHPGCFKIFNLCSERTYDPWKFEGRVSHYPFDDHNPCEFKVMPKFCKEVNEWLNGHPQNVVAIHCKAGKGRTGLMISAYLVFSGVFKTASAALEYFGKQRTENGKGVTIPSQQRYVGYMEEFIVMHTLCFCDTPLQRF